MLWSLHSIPCLGNERETWSDSDDGEDESTAQHGLGAEGTSHDQSDLAHLQFELKQDGYESGDLGDVSHAYNTDAPGGLEGSEQEMGVSPLLGDSGRVKTVGGRVKKISGRVKKIGGQGHEHQHSNERHQKDDKNGRQGGVLSQTCELVAPGSGVISEEMASPPRQELVSEILRTMWRYCHAYYISNSVSVFV